MYKLFPGLIVKRAEELNSLYSSPSIIRMIKSRRMRLAGHVVRMGVRGICIGYWWESWKERGFWEDRDIDGWIILRWFLRRYVRVVWTRLIYLRIRICGRLFCVHFNEPSGSIKCWEVLDELNKWWLLKLDSAPWS
jgi:hypothetical protein